MAVTSCVITGTLPLDSTPVSFTRSGFGTPEAAIVFMGRAHSSANPTTSAGLSIGFWDGTNQYASSVFIEDNLSAATLTSRYRYANRIAGERYWDGTAYQNLCQYTIASTTDGVQFTLTDDNTSATRYATVILFKGLSGAKLGNFAFSGTSAIDVTNVGFKPDVVFYVNPVAADAYTTNTVDNQACHLVFGVAHNDSANTITQHCVTFWSGNNASDTLVNTSTNDNCIGRRWYDDVSNFTEIISAFDANGFTVTPGSSTSSRPFYLAMKLDDPDDAYVGIIDSKTSTGTQAYTGTGFTPQLLLLASTTETAVNQSSTSPSGALMIGATDGTAQQSLIAMDDDAAATSDANSRADTSNVLNLRFDNDTVDAVAAYSSFDSDGFTLNYSDGSASARKILAFAIGDSAGGGATITGSGTPTAQASTVSGTAERSVTGSGTPTAQASTVAGVAERVITSSGALASQSSAVAGSGSVGNAISGSGTLLAQSSQVAGTAERSVTGSGTPASQSATVSGAAERIVTGTGTPTSQSSTVSGTGQVGNVVTGSGSPTAQSATVSGTAERTVTSSGALSAQSSTVAGTAERTITGSGALSAQSSTVYGFDSAPVVPDTGGGGSRTVAFSSRKLRQELEEWEQKNQEKERLKRLMREDEELVLIMLALAA